MDIKSYIVSLFQATPGLELYDLSEGTNIYDLVINPLINIFSEETGLSEISTEREMRAISYMAEMSLANLKNLAQAKGITLSLPSRSSTLIKLSFSSPIDWTIEAGTTLVYGDAMFVTRDRTVISAAILSGHMDGSHLYVYHDLYVYSDSGASVPENSLGYIQGAPPELVKIEHPAIINGITDETVETLLDKIRNSDRRATGASPDSIKYIIARYYPSAAVAVVGPGDSRMERDIVYNYVYGSKNPKQSSTYHGKIRRNTTYNANAAYFTCIPQLSISDPLSAFDPEDELNQGQYMSIVEEADASLVLSTQDIMNETFTQSSERIGVSSLVVADAEAGTREIEVDDASVFSPGDNVNITDDTYVTPTQSGIVEEVNEPENKVTLYNNLSITVPAGTTRIVIVNAEGYYVGPGWIKSEHGMPMGTCLDDNEVMVINDELVMGTQNDGLGVNVVKQIFSRYGTINMVSRLMDHMGVAVRIGVGNSGATEETSTPTMEK